MLGSPWCRLGATPTRHRTWVVVGSLLSLAFAAAFGPEEHTSPPLRFAISFPAARSANPLDGRVLLFISDDGKTEPRLQTDQYRANSTRPIFGLDVDGLAPGSAVIIDDTIVGWPLRSLKDIPDGEYWVQAMLARYETFPRSDGHTIKMPMDTETIEITCTRRSKIAISWSWRSGRTGARAASTTHGPRCSAL
jgi:hypothetical protein